MVEMSDIKGCYLYYLEIFQYVFLLFLISATEGEETDGSQIRGVAKLDNDARFHP